MENKNKLSKKFWFLIISFCIVLITLVTIVFIVFNNRDAEVIEKEENGAKVFLNYTNDINGLKLVNMTPTVDEVGKINFNDDEYLDFSIQVYLDNAREVEYEISIIKDNQNSTVPDDDIKIYLEKEVSGTYTEVFAPQKFQAIKKKSDLGSQVGSMVLYKTKKSNSIADNYRLRVWVSDKSIIKNGSYNIEVAVNGGAK